MNNKLVDMAIEVLLINNDLPYRINWKNEEPLYKFSIDDFSIYAFEQTWESTALGFGGIGGDVMTTAMTYVFVPLTCHQNCFIYFGGKFAYEAPYSDILMEDIKNYRMESRDRSYKYFKTEEN